MKKTLFIVLLCVGVIAQAQAVFEYSFPASYDGSGSTVTDLSDAGNDTTLDGAGAALIDDRPLGFDLSLMSITGANGGHGATGVIDLLDNASVAAAGGFTMECWTKWDGVYGTGGNVRKMIDYAGTEALRVTQSQIQFILSNSAYVLGMDIVPDTWYHVVGVFDTQGNTPYAGAYGADLDIDGVMSLYIDGVLIDSQAGTKTGFGDNLNRPIGINRWAGGSGDHYQGLNFNPTVYLGLPIEDIAHTPTPDNRETSVMVTTNLNWESPDAYAPVGYRVYFGTNEPNELKTDYDLTELTTGIEDILTITPPTLEFETMYYWVVDTYEPNEAGASLHQGKSWSFTTSVQDIAPIVDAGDNIITADILAMSPISLLGSVTNDDTSATTISWQAFDVAFGGGDTTNIKVQFADLTDPDTTVTISEAGIYALKLTATDATGSVSSQKEIVVYADACEAEKATGTWAANYFDLDGDCDVDIVDFAAFAAEWLSSTAMTENFLFAREVADADGTEALFAEYWTGIAGNEPNALLEDPAYPDSPDGAYLIAGELRGGINEGSYGQRIRGYIVPPTTGEYTFYIASDDASRLFLSADIAPVDTDSALKNQIAEVTSYTGADIWDDEPAQASESVFLTAGNYYYIEVLHKEGTGADHVSVGWTVPGTTEIVVIPGTALRYALP